MWEGYILLLLRIPDIFAFTNNFICSIFHIIAIFSPVPTFECGMFSILFEPVYCKVWFFSSFIILNSNPQLISINNKDPFRMIYRIYNTFLYFPDNPFHLQFLKQYSSPHLYCFKLHILELLY